MVSRSYTNFDLSIEQDGENYRAHVLQSYAGEGQVEFNLPFSALELENFTLKIGRARRGGARSLRGSDSPELAAAKEFGARLFEAVFQGDVYACLRSSLEEAETRQQGLRVLLRLPPELANLPWEYLYNPAWNQFFSLSVDTPLVRYLELTPPVHPLALDPPLRLLVVISSPSDYDALDVEREWRDLQAALQPLVARGLMVIERLESASLLALQRQLRRSTYHIFHFIGHGIFDERKQDGVLLFTDEQGRGHPVSGQDLGTLLRDHNSLRLALLNSCEGARTGKDDPFSGAAYSLVQMGLPSVIAMQFEISDSAAVLFAQEFYTALADGYGVDAALSDARKAIFASDGNVEWGTPVLFSRTLDGRIFDLTPLPTPVTPPPAAVAPSAPSRMDLGSGAEIEGGAMLEDAKISTAITRQKSTPWSGKLIPWLRSNRRRVALLGLALIGLCGLIVTLVNTLGNPGAISITASITPSAPSGVISEAGTPALSPSATPSVTPGVTPSLTPTAMIVIPTLFPGMALIPAGPFQMGANQEYEDEKPIHSVPLSAFGMDMYEVTNADYAKCVAARACRPPGNTSSSTRDDYYTNVRYANYPVLYVAWEDAKTYCQWRDGARLPTEAEWEKAARGGLEGNPYPWGDRAPVCTRGAANGVQFDGCTAKDTAAVGSFAANGYGLFDMAGNVREWTADWYGASYYQNAPAKDPPGSPRGEARVARGGSWYDDPDGLRVALRGRYSPDFRLYVLGFRCAATLKLRE